MGCKLRQRYWGPFFMILRFNQVQQNRNAEFNFFGVEAVFPASQQQHQQQQQQRQHKKSFNGFLESSPCRFFFFLLFFNKTFLLLLLVSTGLCFMASDDIELGFTTFLLVTAVPPSCFVAFPFLVSFSLGPSLGSSSHTVVGLWLFFADLAQIRIWFFCSSRRTQLLSHFFCSLSCFFCLLCSSLFFLLQLMPKGGEGRYANSEV